MSQRIYVGNLPFNATEEEVRDVFGAHGNVHAVEMVNDRETGRPRGFGFVDMDEADAKNAIAALDGSNLGGRTLRVNEAQARTQQHGSRPSW